MEATKEVSKCCGTEIVRKAFFWASAECKKCGGCCMNGRNRKKVSNGSK